MNSGNCEVFFSETELCPQDQAKHISDQLLAIYPELRRIARSLLRKERTHHTLQATSLANEAVTRMLRYEAEGWSARTLVAFGIREMQTILIDSGRRFQTRMQYERTSTSDDAKFSRIFDMTHLQLCLERLGQLDPRAREIVELRFFVGLTIHEVADYLGLSSRTVNEDWEFARCWLADHWHRLNGKLEGQESK